MSKSKLVFCTIILTYFLIFFGGYVASSESGMGCGPEWPLCNGKVIPILHGDTLIEFGHRVIGAILFIVTIFLFIKIKRLNASKLENTVANWMLGLLSLQLILGAIVVFYDLPPIIVTIHLLMALVFLTILVWFWRYDRSFHQNKRNFYNPIKKHLNILIVLLFTTIGFGAYIKHQDYGLACNWLRCGESFFPATTPEMIQSIHRLLALISTLYTLLIVFKVFAGNYPVLKPRMIGMLIVILVQLIIGIMTILSFVSLSFAVSHLAVATLHYAIVVEARILLTKT